MKKFEISDDLKYHLLLGTKTSIPWLRCVLWVAWALVVARSFYSASIQAAGEFVFPLDDAYIYLRYATDYFTHGPFVLSGTEGITSGSTSVAYPIFPALFHILGVSHSRLPIWTFWLSALLLGICAHLSYELASALLRHGESKLRAASPGDPARAISSFQERADQVQSWDSFKRAQWRTRSAFLFGGLATNLTGLLAGIMVLNSPYIVWGILVGMEGGLYGSVLLGVLLVWIRNTGAEQGETSPDLKHTRFILPSLRSVPGRDNKNRVLLLVLLGLLPLTRPEGILITGMLILFASLSQRKGKRLSALSTLLLTLLPWILFLIMHRICVGRFSPNTAVAKSITNEPYLDFARYWELMKNNLEAVFQRIRGDIKHGEPLFIWPAMVLGLTLISVALGLRDFLLPPTKALWIKTKCLFKKSYTDTSTASAHAPNPYKGFRSAWVAVSAAAIATLAGLTQNRVLFFDNFRYLLGLLILIVILSSAIMGLISKKLHITLLLAFAAYFALSSAKEPMKRVRREYGVHARDIARFQIDIGRYVDKNLPQKVRIGVNDAGAIPYYARRPALDIVGLTTNGLAAAFRNGNGSLYEALEKIPETERPTHFAIFRRYLGGSGLLGKSVFNPRTRRKSGSWSNLNVLYEAKWEHLGVDREIPYEARQEIDSEKVRIVDRVDVSDLESEEKHDYVNPRPDLKWHAWRIHYSLVRLERNSSAGPSKKKIPLADGGRSITTGEQMKVRLCGEGRECYWVGRFAAYRRVKVSLWVDNRKIGDITIPRSTRFRIFTMKLQGISQKKGTLSLKVEEKTRKKGELKPKYVAYQHWIVAGTNGTNGTSRTKGNSPETTRKDDKNKKTINKAVSFD